MLMSVRLLSLKSADGARHGRIIKAHASFYSQKLAVLLWMLWHDFSSKATPSFIHFKYDPQIQASDTKFLRL
jgi:hypothetical protein